MCLSPPGSTRRAPPEGAAKAPKTPQETRTMHRSRSNTRRSRKAFKNRAGKTARLNTTAPLRGGIRL